MSHGLEIPLFNFGRDSCWDCNRAQSRCICSEIKPFETEPLIVLLIHPKEFRKTVGTARIVKLSIQNSKYWTGHGPDFDENQGLLELLADPTLFVTVLYPGPQSLNLSSLPEAELKAQIPVGRRLAILVIDGTWPCAQKMIKTSKILRALPQLSFKVKAESTYGFRKQPHAYCLSTVEAVVQLIENLNQKGLCPLSPPNAHLQMLTAFHALVKSQEKYLDGDGWKLRKEQRMF